MFKIISIDYFPTIQVFLRNQLIGSNQWQQVFLRNQLIGSNQWQVIVGILNFHRLCLGGMRKIYQLIFKVGNE